MTKTEKQTNSQLTSRYLNDMSLIKKQSSTYENLSTRRQSSFPKFASTLFRPTQSCLYWGETVWPASLIANRDAALRRLTNSGGINNLYKSPNTWIFQRTAKPTKLHRLNQYYEEEFSHFCAPLSIPSDRVAWNNIILGLMRCFSFYTDVFKSDNSVGFGVYTKNQK